MRLPTDPRATSVRIASSLLLAAVLVFLLAPAIAPEGSVVGLVPHAAGGAFCHQEPSRTFAIQERLLPVCARCTGLLLGGAGALLLLSFTGVARRRTLAGAAPLLAGIGLVVAHVAWGAAGLPDGGPPVRFAVGLAAAAVVAPHLLRAVEQMRRPGSSRRTAS